jgi:type I thyroxine 5'-deiodinase
MDNKVDQLYAAWPERMIDIDGQGKILYAGKQGPWGFKPEEVERVVRRMRPPSAR